MKQVAFFLIVLLACADASAGAWSNLWLTPDQQGQRLLDSGDAAEAAQQFNDPRRRAYADLKAGHYDAAASQLKSFEDVDSLYNRGNALARSGKLKDALAAYDAALAKAPDNRDARHNRDLVARQLQKQNGGNQGSGKNGGQQGKGQKNGGQSNDQNKGGSNGQNNQSDQNSQSGEGNRNDSNAGGSKSGEQPNEQRNAGGKSPGSGQSRGDSSSNQPQPQQQGGNSQPQNSPEQAQGAGKEGESNPSQQRMAQGKQNGNTGQNAGASENETGNQQSREQQAEEARRDAAAAFEQGNAPKGAVAAGTTEEKPKSEQALALEQWLRRIPEDPGGLLRRKFLVEHMKKQQQESGQ